MQVFFGPNNVGFKFNLGDIIDGNWMEHPLTTQVIEKIVYSPGSEISEDKPYEIGESALLSNQVDMNIAPSDEPLFPGDTSGTPKDIVASGYFDFVLKRDIDFVQPTVSVIQDGDVSRDDVYVEFYMPESTESLIDFANDLYDSLASQVSTVPGLGVHSLGLVGLDVNAEQFNLVFHVDSDPNSRLGAIITDFTKSPIARTLSSEEVYRYRFTLTIFKTYSSASPSEEDLAIDDTSDELS